MIAIDLPGGDAKVRPTTTASQPAATRAIAPAIAPNARHRCKTVLFLIVIEMLDTRAGCFEVAVDINETVYPDTQPGPAKAWFGIQIKRKQFDRSVHIQPSRLWRDHGDEYFMVTRNFRKTVTLLQQTLNDVGKIFVTRGLHQLPFRRQPPDRLDARLLCKHIGRQGS